MVARSGVGLEDGASVSIRYDDGAVREFAFERVRMADFEGSVPWRTMRSYLGQRHYSGSYASATMGGFVVHESRLELARLLLADFDPRVRLIYAQPFLLAARVRGRMRRHVPDFLLVHAGGTARLVNVKPGELAAEEKIAQALAWPGALAERQGWEYEVWSGADVTLLANVRFLAGYRRPGVVSRAEVERAWAEVCDGERIADVEARLADGGPGFSVRPALMALLWSGRLTTDLSVPLSGESVLRRSA